MPVWDADVALDADLASELIGSRFPTLAPLRLVEMGVGWDNHAYLVNERYVFRIPHRRQAAQLIQTEVAALRYLAGRLPLPVPTVEFYAEPEGRYPYPFMGYPFFRGEVASEQEWSDELRAREALPLAYFLKALHDLPTQVAEVPTMPLDTIRRADMAFRLPIVRKKITELGSEVPEGRRILALMEDLMEAGHGEEPVVWVHGDLYPRHLLVDAAHAICGVIDWGDVHWGDRAIDLAIAFMFLPSSSWDSFREAYGGVDGATWDRARFRALTHAVYLFEYAVHEGLDSYLSEARFTLSNALV